MPRAPRKPRHPARFEDLADLCQDVVFVLDTKARILFVNQSGARMLAGGAPPGEAPTPQETLFPGPLAARHAAAVAEVVRTGRQRSSEGEEADGRMLQTRLMPIRSASGRVVAVLGLSRDLGATRVAREAELRYRASVEQAAIGIANASLDGRIISVNGRLCEILGRPADELLGSSLRDALSTDGPSAADLEILERPDRRAPSFVREVVSTRKDGVAVWIHASVSLIRDDRDRPTELIAVVEDVSTRRLLEERLRQAEKLEAIGQLAGGVAHDFNNQLTAIIGYAELLSQIAGSEDQRRYAASILESARRSAGLTRQLLAFARKGQFQRTAVNLHVLLAEVSEVLERSIDKRIRIEHVLRAATPTVVGDANLLQNAVLNLALNGRDAMPEGGRLTFETDEVRVGGGSAGGHPHELAPGSYVTLAVSDTGCGMDQTVISRLFEPFFTTKEPGRGTGLGLAAAFGTARRHGGTIAVSSALGHGSTFRLYLPLAREIARDENAPQESPALSAAGSVLIIDDEKAVREMAAEVLRAHGFAVAAFSNGRAGVEHYQGHWQEIDLVLLDLAMPEMDGAETFGWLRRINPFARILLTSGYSSDGDADTLLGRGAVGFLPKPFEGAALAQRVSLALAAHVATPPGA